MDKEYDAELEEINKLMKPHVQSGYPWKIKIIPRKPFMFQLELVMCQKSLILLDIQMAINQKINQSTNQPTNQLSPT